MKYTGAPAWLGEFRLPNVSSFNFVVFGSLGILVMDFLVGAYFQSNSQVTDV